MIALVTGAGGFAGRHLVARLLRDGHEVLAAGPPEAETPAGARWAELDVTDGTAVERLLGEARPELVFHLAGFAHVGQAEQRPEACLAVNFGGARHVLEACLARCPGARVLLVSSAEVYGPVPAERMPVVESEPRRPATVYAVSKAAAELAASHAVARGLDVVVVRPFNHIGPGQSDAFVASSFAHQIARIEAGRQPPVLRVGNLRAVRDMMHVRDAVEAYVRLAERGLRGEAYNVTSGCAVSIQDVLDGLLALARVPIEVEQDPSRLRAGDAPVFHGSAEKLARATGLRPGLDLPAVLREVLDYWRAREPAEAR